MVNTCKNLASQLEEADSLGDKTSLSNQLIDHLDANCRQRWISTIENVDMKSLSRRAWSTLNKEKECITYSNLHESKLCSILSFIQWQVQKSKQRFHQRYLLLHLCYLTYIHTICHRPSARNTSTQTTLPSNQFARTSLV